MGLYGDKLTKSDGSGVDVLTKSAGTAFDGLTKTQTVQNVLLTKSAGTAFDGLTKSAGTAFDGLSKTSDAAQDNLLQHYILINEDFEGPAVGGVISGWEVYVGIGTIENPGVAGTKSQRVTDAYYEGGAYIFKSFGFTIDKQFLRLRFTYRANALNSKFIVAQRGSNTGIYNISAPSQLSTINVDVTFFADGMTGLDFKIESTDDGDYLEIDNVILEVHKQDNLAYTI